MSNTMEIYCDTCQEQYWYGQKNGGETKIYDSRLLGMFLTKHEYCKLHTASAYSSEEMEKTDISKYKYFKREAKDASA